MNFRMLFDLEMTRGILLRQNSMLFTNGFSAGA